MQDRSKLRPLDRAAIRAESGCDERTIAAYPNVKESSAARIERAADKLGIALPGRKTVRVRASAPEDPRAAEKRRVLAVVLEIAAKLPAEQRARLESDLALKLGS